MPGHWEGDLIFAKKMTSIGTLVERKTRYLMLIRLPKGHGDTMGHAPRLRVSTTVISSTAA